MKARLTFGLLFGAFVGFIGLFGFQAKTAAGAAIFVACFALGFAGVFSVVSDKAIERITFFFTHYWW